MSHLYIFPTMHHIPLKPQWSIFIMYQWQLIDPSSSMHSHQGKYILYYINNQSIYQFDINQSLDINQSNHWHQWQHDPTISPFGIDGNTNIDVNTNYQLLMSTCRYNMLYINSQCDYLSPSININHINVIYSPPLTSMEKGHSHLGAAPLAWILLGVAPPVWMP